MPIYVIIYFRKMEWVVRLTPNFVDRVNYLKVLAKRGSYEAE